jgi:hypothetical protein
MDVKYGLQAGRNNNSKERCVLFRIGFDPGLDAGQQHKELIKQVEQYRFVEEAMLNSQPKVRNTSRILALLGKGIASLGSSLEDRFNDNQDTQVNVSTQSNPGGCTS